MADKRPPESIADDALDEVQGAGIPDLVLKRGRLDRETFGLTAATPSATADQDGKGLLAHELTHIQQQGGKTE